MDSLALIMVHFRSLKYEKCVYSQAQDLRLVVKYNISHQMKDLKYQLLFWRLVRIQFTQEGTT